jgi:DMSO/TMAO reductase YedYZ molybdopterin-dependent catalytic subunit
MGKPLVIIGLIVTLFSPARAFAQAEALLRVAGEIESALSLGPEEFTKLPRKTVRATDHGGTEAEFEGVPLFEILTRAGAPLGERLRGEAMATYVVVEAADGYRAVFALAELDPAFTDRLVLLADRRDGQPMTKPQGPLRIVVPGEKRHGRWVRMVETISIQRAPADRGRAGEAVKSQPPAKES